MRTGNIVSIAALSLAVLTFAPQMASAERSCTRTYHDGVMRERCVNREPAIRTEGRGHRDNDWREERRGRAGVEVRVPGIGIELGR